MSAVYLAPARRIETHKVRPMLDKSDTRCNEATAHGEGSIGAGVAEGRKGQRQTTLQAIMHSRAQKHGERKTMPPLTAPDYIISSFGSSACDGADKPLVDSASCKAAATALSLPFASSGSWPGNVHGCHTIKHFNNVRYNRHAGRANPVQAVICKRAVAARSEQRMPFIGVYTPPDPLFPR